MAPSPLSGVTSQPPSAHHLKPCALRLLGTSPSISWWFALLSSQKRIIRRKNKQKRGDTSKYIKNALRPSGIGFSQDSELISAPQPCLTSGLRIRGDTGRERLDQFWAKEQRQTGCASGVQSSSFPGGGKGLKSTEVPQMLVKFDRSLYLFVWFGADLYRRADSLPLLERKDDRGLF